ncbi:MAG: germination protein YpeB [Clostridia bacterium]|nr:germination protein YpeB [Clostridia bacterium]
MTNTTKTVTFFLVALLVLCGGVIASFATKASFANEQNQQLKRQIDDSKQYHIQLENCYEKAMFELADSLDNMQANLSKLHASNGRANQQLLLTKIVAEAETAESDAGSLPVDNEWLKKTAEFANKTSDFCLSLQTKLAGGGVLAQNDRKTLKWLSTTSQTLANRVATISQRVGNDFLLADGVLQKGRIDGIDNEFDEVDKATFDYPQMIYDGPFSDSKKHKITVDLPRMTAGQVEQKIAKQLDDFGIKKVQYVGETKNKLDVYNFEVVFDDGGKGYLQASQNGGMICYMSSTGCKGRANSKQDAMDVARQFANKLGYQVEPVWVSKQNDGPTYVNLAPVVSGVIIYPDLVKVSVDDNGVCGFEGLNYLANHKNRQFDKMSRDVAKAKQSLAQGMVVTNENMALVPKGDKEILCFEFECHMDGDQYFVYIDASTFDEVDIFKVVKGTEGYTVI